MANKLNFTSRGLNNQLPYPQLGINLWNQGSTAYKIVQSVDEWGNVTDTKIPFQFSGVIQPLRPEEVRYEEERFNTEGQYSWEWFWFHTKPNVRLKTNDRVTYKNIIYKVMAIKDYADYGHIEYRVIKDWQDEETD